jgi:hypothetical protein
MTLKKHNELKELHKTIDKILKARKIQKTRVNENVIS